MSRGRFTFFLISAVLVLTLLTGSLLGTVRADTPDGDDSLYKYLSVFTEVLSLIRQAYVDSPEIGDLMTGALDGTTDALDPFSLYVPPGQVEGYVAAAESGERLTGLTLLKERGVAYVVAVTPGGPAAEADLRLGDLVARIDGELTREMPLWEVQQGLGGEVGKQVRLEVIRQGETLEKTIELGAFEASGIAFEEADGLPVARLSALDAASVEALRSYLRELESDRLLLDLRRSSAGDPEVAFALADLFAEGDLGTLQERSEAVATFTSSGEPLWSGRLVLLVGRGTFGPGEILATVLRQKTDAELVGERTFGWAGERASADLASGGRLFYTSAFYTGPDGEPLSSSLSPDTRVRRIDAGFGDGEVSMEELIFRRGLERLKAEDEAEPLEQQAA
ncbi:MAG: S41 family peptidase [Acidobacteriota bacterium]